MTQETRWHQRFSNYKKALQKLSTAAEVLQGYDRLFADDKIELLKEGLIQRFEYTHELAWKVMKDFAEYQGNTEIRGSRDATREGFKMQLIEDAETWMDMLRSRNITSHTYDETTAGDVNDKVINSYLPLFKDFETKMEFLQNGAQTHLFDQEL